jgi:predicted transglutaminase-like cysteine proteinase
MLDVIAVVSLLVTVDSALQALKLTAKKLAKINGVNFMLNLKINLINNNDCLQTL